MNAIKFWAAFSIGVAAGAVVALLCAPQSGEKTRKQIRQKIDDAGDYIKDTAEDLGEKANEVYKRGKDAVSDLGDKATGVYKKGKDSAAEYSDDLAGDIRAAVRGVKA